MLWILFLKEARNTLSHVDRVGPNSICIYSFDSGDEKTTSIAVDVKCKTTLLSKAQPTNVSNNRHVETSWHTGIQDIAINRETSHWLWRLNVTVKTFVTFEWRRSLKFLCVSEKFLMTLILEETQTWPYLFVWQWGTLSDVRSFNT